MKNMLRREPRTTNLPVMRNGRSPMPRADVVEFLNEYDELKERCDSLETMLSGRNLDCAGYQNRLAMLQDEVRRLTVQRDAFQRGFFELRAQMTVLATAAVGTAEEIAALTQGAVKRVADTAIKSLEAASAAMLRDGIDVADHEREVVARQSDNVEAEIKNIAAKFGANAREDE